MFSVHIFNVFWLVVLSDCPSSGPCYQIYETWLGIMNMPQNGNALLEIEVEEEDCILFLLPQDACNNVSAVLVEVQTKEENAFLKTKARGMYSGMWKATIVL